MRPPLFADTGYYVAQVSPRDFLHAAARGYTSTHTGRVFTTEYVLVEVGNFLLRGPDRAAYLGLVRNLRADPLATIIPASAELFQRGLALFAARPDKEWSLTDCVSFEVMAELGLADALTADRHFEQAGFRVLLQPAAGV